MACEARSHSDWARPHEAAESTAPETSRFSPGRTCTLRSNSVEARAEHLTPWPYTVVNLHLETLDDSPTSRVRRPFEKHDSRSSRYERLAWAEVSPLTNQPERRQRLPRLKLK